MVREGKTDLLLRLLGARLREMDDEGGRTLSQMSCQPRGDDLRCSARGRKRGAQRFGKRVLSSQIFPGRTTVQ